MTDQPRRPARRERVVIVGPVPYGFADLPEDQQRVITREWARRIIAALRDDDRQDGDDGQDSGQDREHDA